jgi:hypothetical protein
MRSFWAYFGLSIITCGIYTWFFVYQMQNDINVACQGDGKDMDPVLALILAIVLPGIFTLIWLYTQGERLRARGAYSNIRIADTGATYLLWYILGSCIIIGPLIAIAKFITNSNIVFDDYNRRMYSNGQGYNNGYNPNNYNPNGF